MAIDVLDVIGLRLFKQQIEFEEDDRDELITLYAQAAFDYCIRWCDEPAWKVAADIPAAVKEPFSLSLLTCLNTAPRKAKYSFMRTLQPNA